MIVSFFLAIKSVCVSSRYEPACEAYAKARSAQLRAMLNCRLSACRRIIVPQDTPCPLRCPSHAELAVELRKGVRRLHGHALEGDRVRERQPPRVQAEPRRRPCRRAGGGAR